MYRKHYYMFRLICINFRQSYPSTVLKLQKILKLQTKQKQNIKMFA